MTLFLVRHAHAVAAAENPERPLSKRGHRQVRAIARFLRTTDAFRSAEMWHSPFARSRETATLLVKRIRLKARLVETDGLEGGDDPQVIARCLESRRTSLAIVGHEPHLSALASLLVAGVAAPPRFVLQKGAILALEKIDDDWAALWQISPDLLT